MKNLISMTDFILEENIKIKNPRDNHIPSGRFDYILNVSNYANFLKQPLTLGMFVPCDDEGNVLNEVKEFDNSVGSDENYNRALKNYKIAKENVLFKGFEEGVWEGYATIKYNSDGECLEIDNEFCQNKIIEDLVKYKLTLTETAIKQLRYS